MSRLILILNEEIPRDLRRALDREAKAENVTVNDVAGSILAEDYGLQWELSGNPFRKISTRFKLHVPQELHRAIALEAYDEGHSMRGVVLSRLSSHFGTKPISPARRPRKEFA